MTKIKVVELFAGVGGFRIGLERANKSKSNEAKYQIVMSNQWEPSTKTQHASDIYSKKFKSGIHINDDIEAVIEKDFSKIVNHDLLVGGFPCQDYSVAKTLSNSKGIIGKKGVLWWSIFNILKKKGKHAPSYIMLENVDRLLKSPVKQRGRDFAIMLSSLSDLGYAVEWRVINAAEYGFPQRRKRVFILGYKKGTKAYEKIAKQKSLDNWIYKDGIIAKAFPVEKFNTDNVKKFDIRGDLVDLTENFDIKDPFDNSGVIIDRKVVTVKTKALYKGKKKLLKDVLIDDKDVPEEFFISDEQYDRWKYLKGAKKEKRVAKSGFEYNYAEGAMTFPDAPDRPSRTIITGEGGTSPSRFKHVVKTKSGRLRRLTPVELEELCMFPKNHTAGVADNKRAFLMGNALVVGVVEKLGVSLRDFV